MKERKSDDTIVKKVVDEQTGEERIITLHKDHPKPTTRREFLATGMLGFSGMLVAPSILNVLARPEFAFGQEAGACSVQGLNLPAFITVNLSGGNSLSSNLPPLGEGREPLAKYDLLGLGPDSSVFTDETRGMDFLGIRVSGRRDANVPAGHFWLGLGTTASATTLGKVSVMSICVTSNDDTSTNLYDASGMILKAGRTGELLPNVGSRDGNGTGVNQKAALVNPESPLIVSNYSDIERALKPAGTLATRLTDSRRRKLLELVNSLSGSQARSIAAAGSATGTTLAKLVECATGKNIELSATTDPGIDPAIGANNIAAVWNLNPANKGGANYARAAMVYNTIKGNSSTCGIDEGGNDYHGNGRQNQNAKDRTNGELVGRILESAAVLQKPVMINILSDGSVSAPANSAYGDGFTNDSGVRGMSIVIAFHPDKKPELKNDQFKYQVGFFTPGQGASDQSVVRTTTDAAAVVAANYMAFAGIGSKFESVVPGVFQRSELDEVIRFTGSGS